MLKLLQPKLFNSEKILQTLIEDNIDFLGLELIKSEYSLCGKRIDSFCVGENLTVIEYKKDRKNYQQSQIISYSQLIYKEIYKVLDDIDLFYKNEIISKPAYESCVRKISELSSDKKIKKICIANSYDKYTYEIKSDIVFLTYDLYEDILVLRDIHTNEIMVLRNIEKKYNDVSDDYILVLNKRNYLDFDLTEYKEYSFSINKEIQKGDFYSVLGNRTIGNLYDRLICVFEAAKDSDIDLEVSFRRR